MSDQTDEKKDYHFLVVDDDDQSRETIVEYLRTMGYEKITSAKDGAEAIRIIEHTPSINFIISDWDMPMVNGLGLLQRVRTHPMRSHIPFLIATSPISQEAEKIILAAENMVDSYIIKPFRSNVLEEKIKDILSKSVHGPQKQVVLVDDDQDARETVAEYLDSMGFKDVKLFTNGHEALEYLKENALNVGLIVSDWEMPEINGIELLKFCKSNSTMAQIPFLMITSQSSMEKMKVVQAAKASVDQYLLKPFNISEIKDRIKQVMEKSRSRAEVQILILKAQENAEAGRYEGARRYFEQALQLDPEQDTALRGLGEITMKTKGVEHALPYFKRAVEANPYSIHNYLMLCNAYEKTGFPDKAISLIQTGIQHVSFSAELHFQLGQLYYKKGQYDPALAEFEKTVELQLDHKEAKLMIDMITGGRR